MGDLTPGQVISLPDGRRAVIRFVGDAHFAPGSWVGIELEEPTGKNDGSVQGERYFECDPGFGMFIRPTAVAALLEQPIQEPRQTPAAPRPNASLRSRPTSMITSSGTAAKRSSVMTASRRTSSMSSPSPAPRPPPVAGRSLRVRICNPSRSLLLTRTSLLPNLR